MSGVMIDDCPACGTMNSRAAGGSIQCRSCGADIVPHSIYECQGCGETMEGPPKEGPTFEVEIERNECDVCEFLIDKPRP